MKTSALVCLVALVGFNACEFGVAAEGPPGEEGAVTGSLTSDEPAPPPATRRSAGQPDVVQAQPSGPATPQVPNQWGSPCADLSGGQPRPVPCLPPLLAPPSRAHGDPDPWNPTPGTSPY